MEIIALDAHKRYSQVRYGKLRNDVNHYLKWAYCEAGNSTAVNHKRFPLRHTSKLYKRIRERKGHKVLNRWRTFGRGEFLGINTK